MLTDYQIFCVSIRGASHIRSDTPKEDSADVYKGDQGWIGVVCDGHGDSRCMRSDVGSQIAVKTAIRFLREWLDEQQPKRIELDSAIFPNTSTDQKTEASETVKILTGDDSLIDSDSSPKNTSIVSQSFGIYEQSQAKNTENEKLDSEKKSKEEVVSSIPEESTLVAEKLLPEKAWSDERIFRLCNDITVQWKTEVVNHYDVNPLTEAEIKAAGNLYTTYAEGEKIPHIYGTTLLAAVMTDNRMLLIQKGDGHAMFVYKDGTTSHEVIPWDDRCVLNRTTSLCDSDAADTFQYAIVDLPGEPEIAAVFLATDGLEDCYADMHATEAFVGQTAVFGAREGMTGLQAYLESELSGLSDRASQDDISIVGFIYSSAVLPLKRRFDLLKDYYRIYTSLKEAQSHIGSMSGSIQRLNDRIQKTENELDRLQAQKEELELSKQSIESKNDENNTRIQASPLMQHAHSIMLDFISTEGIRIRSLAEEMKSFGSILEDIDNNTQEIEKMSTKNERIEKEINELQNQYNELKEKHAEFNVRYQHWISRRCEAEQQLARIKKELSSATSPNTKYENAEEAFRKMMED